MRMEPSDGIDIAYKIMTDLVSVTCPSCFQIFEVAAPGFGEIPCDVDYDCEVCCRPLRIYFEEDDGEVMATGYGLGD
jgi:hypothetical protein